jgi:periplasmic divalent cation tolerance protein
MGDNMRTNLFTALSKKLKSKVGLEAPEFEEFCMDQLDAVIVLTTWPATGDPAALATTIVEERLAACVSLLPEMESVYSWQGTVQRDRERQLLIKTTARRLEVLERRLAELHPYDVPEFLVLPLVAAAAPYVSWLRAATETAANPRQN